MSDSLPPAAAPEREPFFRTLARGAKHVLVVAWTVPAVRSQLVTWLVRAGLPGGLVAIGVALGDALNK